MKHPLLNNSFRFLYGAVAILFLFTSCKKEYSAEDIPIPPVVKDHNILLKFKAVVNDTLPLNFDTTTYTNYFREPFTVSAFKFYIQYHEYKI